MAKIKGKRTTGKAAQYVALMPAQAADKPAADRADWYVGCAFEGCDQRFLPHSIGRAVHGSCDESRAFQRKAYKPTVAKIGEAAARKVVFELFGIEERPEPKAK